MYVEDVEAINAISLIDTLQSDIQHNIEEIK